MNTDKLIEAMHKANATRRQAEWQRGGRRGWTVGVAVATAAVVALLLWPRGAKQAVAESQARVYCNSECNADEVIALINNSINHLSDYQTL